MGDTETGSSGVDAERSTQEGVWPVLGEAEEGNGGTRGSVTSGLPSPAGLGSNPNSPTVS